MATSRRRWFTVALLLLVVASLWRGLASRAWRLPPLPATPGTPYAAPPDDDFIWRRLKHRYPVTSLRPLPTAGADALPGVQAHFAAEAPERKQQRLQRRDAIRAAFVKSWTAYKEHAWLRDEVTPVTGQQKDTFGGWGATLVDSLDTLWIMDLGADFEAAVDAAHRSISFATTQAHTVNVFETTIRFLGGLLSAYDLSGDARLLAKARDVGHMLYAAFDTPNHLPVTRWDLHAAARGEAQAAHASTLLAEMGSLGLEFTRLSLVTGDARYHDAVQRIAELLAAAQPATKVPGLWPILVDAAAEDFDAGADYALGGMADSAYEYLPKMAALLGQGAGLYADMYARSVEASRAHLFFQPLTPTGEAMLFPGVLHASVTDGLVETRLETSAGHLICFTGGMLALGGRLLANATHLDWAAKLTRGCLWAYDSLPTGVMPETSLLAACPDAASPCAWDESVWHAAVARAQPPGEARATIRDQRLPPGFAHIPDPRYILRPEAIESVFLMYRTTGDPRWQDRAWAMWTAIDALTSTPLANSAVWDVNTPAGEAPAKADSMESFWLGETLKYFYLIFSEPGLVSMDEWVFNTEAHPFRRLRGGTVGV
ncbi:Endoplasmic reticulum mannosyl-oligosaccharide 1,2-alpha-mannosidase [Tolypocladium ophioglossoides CBS 100239]|uniref:alpha-1,2-Mannosidase n=1 Tax=Tolypocladium ophioglossoides (strain CBS 100239) TaxID=1163406 RepID=A0A0L0MXG4_TOLOC|nr:Endoplasmic reticulum mannosyl-oligosaccharide 1,2-alpha-mannosidase [Tolypocladium ophioglossoides CBS 100239]